eukprot:gene10549-14171_t
MSITIQVVIYWIISLSLYFHFMRQAVTSSKTTNSDHNIDNIESISVERYKLPQRKNNENLHILFNESQHVDSDSKRSSKRLHSKSNSFNQQNIPYQPWENEIRKVSITWGDFIQYPISSHVARNKVAIRSSILRGLNICPASELSDQINGTTRSCVDIWSDSYIISWRKRKVKELCMDEANSKIHCYDSNGWARYCVFENAMLSFKKMRKKRQDGGTIRSWERGFISADCGEMGKDDIGYSMLYKPDIEGTEEAICDYVFNETVIAFSHENIRNLGITISDYLNVWAMLWLGGISQESRDVTFLNIDSLRKGKYNADQPNHFFRTYDASFRRVIKAIDFAEPVPSKVCFKKIVFQPKPNIPYKWDRSYSSIDSIEDTNMCRPTTNSSAHSSLFQRLNLQIRNNYGFLVESPTQQSFNILLIVRNEMKGSLPLTPQKAASITSRIFSNLPEIVIGLKRLIKQQNEHLNRNNINFNIVVQDLLLLSFEQQVQLISNSSLVIGMHGAGIANTMHMPIGTKFCCGVIEIFPQGEFQSIRGYGNLAKRLGYKYERYDMNNKTATNLNTEKSDGKSEIHVFSLMVIVERMLNFIVMKPSCILPNVISNPYLQLSKR